MRRMLVTGAAGFIGSNFVHFWAEQHRRDAFIRACARLRAMTTRRKSIACCARSIRSGFAVLRVAGVCA